MMTRVSYIQNSWEKCVWFSKATPKFTFMTWVAMLDRLATMDRVVRWNQGVDVTCVLCRREAESRDHLFFRCSFTSMIWEHLVIGVMGSAYTMDWSEIVQAISRSDWDKKRLFVFGMPSKLPFICYGGRGIESSMESLLCLWRLSRDIWRKEFEIN